MIGWTLGRYFFFRYIVITLWLFLGIAALVFIITFTEVSNRMGDLDNFSMGMAFGLSAMQTPMVMQQAVPFIALISGMVTLATLNRKYELVVTRAAGISAWQFLTPICAAAFVFGIVTLVVVNPLAAYGLERAAGLEADMRGGNPGTGGPDAPWIKQRTDEGETIIGARTILNQGQELADATFLRIGDSNEIVERLDAARAYLRDGLWELENVQQMRADMAPEHLETAFVTTNLTPEFVTQRVSRPETLTIFQLPGTIAAARSFGLSGDAFATHFHSMLALPALLIAMTLIAATVSMRFARLGQSAGMILGGVLAGFLLYVVSVLVQAFGSASYVPPVAAAWFPVLVASFVGITFLLYKEDG